MLFYHFFSRPEHLYRNLCSSTLIRKIIRRSLCKILPTFLAYSISISGKTFINEKFILGLQIPWFKIPNIDHKDYRRFYILLLVSVSEEIM